ncbi:hypothetical protein AD936_16250 [Gluconobacter japonicus]|nr:hypothetical protein AD936_16250 [Gluconobacter japonicus]GAN90089.1 hypothetical protein Gbfr_011_003 [Gluconobacter frateurii M-2]
MHDFTNDELFVLDTLLMAYEGEADWAATTYSTTNLVAEGLVEKDPSDVFCRLTLLGLQVAKEARKHTKTELH